MRLNNNIGPLGKIGSERRAYPRIETALPLEIKTKDFDMLTLTRNLSCVGAYCQVNKYLAPMTKLDIVLILNDKDTKVKCRCRGVVVRVEPAEFEQSQARYNIAIYFNDIADSEKQKVARFVKNLLGTS